MRSSIAMSRRSWVEEQPGHHAIKIPTVVTLSLGIIKVLANTMSVADGWNETVGVGVGKATLILTAFIIIAFAYRQAEQPDTKIFPLVYLGCALQLVRVGGMAVIDLFVGRLGIPEWVCLIVLTIATMVVIFGWFHLQQKPSINTLKPRVVQHSTTGQPFSLLHLNYWTLPGQATKLRQAMVTGFVVLGGFTLLGLIVAVSAVATGIIASFGGHIISMFWDLLIDSAKTSRSFVFCIVYILTDDHC